MAEVKPIRLTDENGQVYILEFSRETVELAERRGFKIGELLDSPMTNIPLLFYYSFLKNHPSISKKKTDEILFEKLHGLSDVAQSRLAELYLAPIEALSNEGDSKNATMTMEL